MSYKEELKEILYRSFCKYSCPIEGVDELVELLEKYPDNTDILKCINSMYFITEISGKLQIIKLLVNSEVGEEKIGKIVQALKPCFEEE